MKSLKELLPRASKSFIDANPVFAKGTIGDVLLQQDDKNDSTGNVERIKGKRGGHSISMSGEPYWSEGKPGRHGMNKTEAEFAMILEAMKRNGEILRYEFEGITLRFANVKYTPDFFVSVASVKSMETGHLRTFRHFKFIEVKGPFIRGNRERAVERFRHAKTYWPEFTFELHQKSKDGWKQLI
jgi:hypothetical protein